MCTPIRIAFLAEAGPDIGTGHVVETLELVKHCPLFGLDPLVWVSSATPADLRRRFGVDLLIFDCPREVASVIDAIGSLGIDLIVTNLRKIRIEQVNRLKKVGVPVVCIDELGGRALTADVIVNNSIVSQFWDYGSSQGKAYCGPAYMCINDDYRRRSKRRRSFEGGIKNVVVSMGGVDSSRTTLKIVEALVGWKAEAEKHIVAGPGFDFMAELEEKIRHIDRGFTVHKSPDSLAQILFEGDFGVTAGGNTLYEMACIGMPALILYEDPHERLRGEAFAREGAAVLLGSGVEVSIESIGGTLHELDDPERLTVLSTRGQQLIDGRGVERVLQIIRETALCLQSGYG